MSWRTRQFTESKPIELSSEERRLRLAADFAYTLNHALVCTATDPLTDVPIGILVQNLLGKEAGEEVSWKDFRFHKIWEELKEIYTGKDIPGLAQWGFGEVGGDFGAVAVVTALNRFAPSAVDLIRKIASPIASPILKRTTSRAARKEFVALGKDPNSEECKERAQGMHEIEMRHLPNALLWTFFSPTINLVIQKKVLWGEWRNETSWGRLAVAKGVGATITSGLTLGLRSAIPKQMQQWDDFISGKFAVPILNKVSSMFGVDKEVLQTHMEEMHAKSVHGAAHRHQNNGATNNLSSQKPIQQNSFAAKQTFLHHDTLESKSDSTWGKRTTEDKAARELSATDSPSL